jgi:hypothetical protein
VPGSCSDDPLTMLAGAMDNAIKYMATLADKGFQLHTQFIEKMNHELLTPVKAWVNHGSFTIDEMAHTNFIGNQRIHIERAFERAQDNKILHTVVQIDQIDLWGLVFCVCMLLSNYGPPLVQKGEFRDANGALTKPLVSLAELQWGVRNEVGDGVRLPACLRASSSGGGGGGGGGGG